MRGLTNFFNFMQFSYEKNNEIIYIEHDSFVFCSFLGLNASEPENKLIKIMLTDCVILENIIFKFDFDKA